MLLQLSHNLTHNLLLLASRDVYVHTHDCNTGLVVGNPPRNINICQQIRWEYVWAVKCHLELLLYYFYGFLTNAHIIGLKGNKYYPPTDTPE